MRKSRLKCPYCKEKVGFVRAFQSKKNEEYFCTNCNSFSKVIVSSDLKGFAKLLAVLVCIITVVFTFFVKFYVLGTILIVLFFLAFYLTVPRFIMLKKKDD